MPAHRPRKPRPLRRSTASTLIVMALISSAMLTQAPAQDDAMELAALAAASIAEPVSPEDACWQLPSLDGARFDCTAVRPSQPPEAPPLLTLHLPKTLGQVPEAANIDCDDHCAPSTP